MNTDHVAAFSALDLARMLFGVLIVAAGAVSCLFFAVRLKLREYSLLYFGLGAMLYGVRLFINGSSNYMQEQWDWITEVIALVIPIPLLLFFTATMARRWRKLALWSIGIFCVIGAVGMAELFLVQSERATQKAIHLIAIVVIPVLMVLLFIGGRTASREQKILRAGFFVFLLFIVHTNLGNIGMISHGPDLEFIGFVTFLGCLGYVAAARTQRNEEQLLTLNKELEIARGIQAGLLPEKGFSVAGLTTASRYVPATSVAGDFYDFLPKDGGLGVLIADVSGHGVPAALSASMVKVAITAQRDWANDPARVLSGLNSILCGNLQGQFVTAGYLYLDLQRGALTYAGAGHPPLLAWRGREQRIASIEENGLMLGIFPEGAYKSMTAALEPGDRFVLYTDGITEAPSLTGEEFGMERFKDFMTQNAGRSAQDFCDGLIQHVAAWCGSSDREQHDDLTLIVVDYKAA
ncbi:MAG TPA: SpoIIE family protein phosphatase [Blattabacteriaceae bacterium]|nr:SpoIIE family protein phosphatase [Blattabacteriaceae bacterium]